MNANVQGADFLDTLLLRNNITIKDLADCSNGCYDELMDMERIFDLESEDDFSCCLTIPYLLDPLAAKEICAYFRDEEKGHPFVNSAAPDLEKYRLPLVSAFVFNPSFFAMAWNWCALIRQELQLMMKGKIARFPGVSSPGVEKPHFILQAASGTGSILEIDFGAVRENNPDGRLWIRAKAGKVRFFFRFASYHESPPCHLMVKCRTNKDGKEYSVLLNEELNNRENKELIIRSGNIPDFDYSEVEILGIEGMAYV